MTTPVSVAASESSASQTTTSAPTRCRSSQAALTFLHATAGKSKGTAISSVITVAPRIMPHIQVSDRSGRHADEVIE
jgi:hypothetical protein